MVLIYTENTSPRLQYILHFIFRDLMNIDYSITHGIEHCKNYAGIKINYSSEAIVGSFHIQNHTLLFEYGIIREQMIECFKIDNCKAFFKTEDADFPFDIFAASFYLLSRYEEYLPHQKDEYGRFSHKKSLAFKENFLQLPLINIWVKSFVKKLQEKFPALFIPHPTFNFLPTYDIDIAFAYRHKGLMRNFGGFIKSPSWERIKVLFFGKNDPLDAYAWLDELHRNYKLAPVYFFLVAKKNNKYDKNISPQKQAMQQLAKQHAQKYNVGLHPSWQSGNEASLIQKEKKILEKIIDRPINSSRQHYIKFNLPEDYRKLIHAEIKADYSMGYGSINGFRASVASDFNWYDLQQEEQTTLRIYPFCFMEANSFYEQKYTAAQAYEELMYYYTICKEVNGTLITIWHNDFLGSSEKKFEWKKMYEKFIVQVQ